MIIPIIVFNTYSQNKYDFYTTIHVGDTLTPYFTNTPQILIFASEQSCFTCMMSANSIIKKYATSGVKSVMFLQMSSSLSMSTMIDTSNKDLLVVEDRVGAYKKLYGVKNEGLLFYLNKDAVVRYIGVLGKSSFKINTLDSMVRQDLLTKNDSNHNNSTKGRTQLIYSSVLTKQSQECLENEFARYMEYLPTEKMFCILLNNKALYFYDTLGTFIKTINLQEKVKGVRLFTPTLGGKGFFNNTSVLFINDDDFSSNDPIVLAVDYVHDTVSLVYKRSYVVDTSRIISSINTVPLQSKSTQFVTRQIWRPEFMFDTTKDKDQFLLINQNGEITKSFGVNDPFYKSTNLRSYNWILFGNDDRNNIYAVYALGRNLFTYNSSGSLLNTTQIKYDSAMWSYKWIERAKSYNKDTPVEEFMDMQTKVTMANTNRILVDSVTSTVNIPLVRLINDNQNKKLLMFFIHQIYSNGFQQTIQLPNDCQPFYIRNNIVWGIGSENGCFKLFKFKINEK